MKRNPNKSLNIKRILKENDIYPVRQSIQGERKWVFEDKTYYTLLELYRDLKEDKRIKGE